MRKNKLLATIFIIVASAICTVICGTNTRAITTGNYNTIVSRAKIADLYKCQPFFGDKIDILKLTQPSDILTGGGSDNILALPNGSTKNDSLFSCKTLLDDYMGYSFNGNDNASKASFLKKMGYTVDTSAGSNMSCKKATFARYNDGSTLEYTVCASLNQSKISSLDFSYDKGINGFTFVNDGSIFEVFADGVSVGQIAYQGMSSDDFFSKLDGIFAGAHLLDFRYDGASTSGMSDNDAAESDNIYKKGTLITNMVNSFPRDEQLGLLTYYFSKYGEVSCYWIGGAVELTIGGNTYYVSKKNDAPSTFYVVDGSSWFGTTDWEGIISGLDGQDIQGIGDCENVEPPAADASVDGGTVSGEDEDDPLCFENAGVMGWIMCPLYTAMSKALDGIYKYVETHLLQVQNTGDGYDAGVQTVWGSIRDIANVIFIVFFLFIIFSQLTGYGIDNYGIKRMLPRLIVAAVLVNLSFIVCQLLVDASNIVGASIGGLLKDAASGVAPKYTSSVTRTTVTGVFEAVGAGVLIGALVGTGVVSAGTILSLLIGLAASIISLLFVWVILIVRQIGVIIAIVLAPVAIICYMLPNTEQWFRRWRTLMAGLLLAYPICSLAVGAGLLISNLLATVGQADDSAFMIITAMIARVVPYFLIPSVLRRSLQGLGDIGARISNLGSRATRGAAGAVRNSDGFKAINQVAKENQIRRQAGITKDGKSSNSITNRMKRGFANSSVGKAIGYDKLQAARIGSTVKAVDERQRNERLLAPGYMENYMRQQEIAMDKEALKTEMDVINKDTANGENEDALFSAYDAAVAAGDTTRARAIAEIAGRRKDTAGRFSQKLKEDSAAGSYDGKEGLLQGVAKQMSTGDNSKNYRAADALGFEFAAQVNRGEASSTNYKTWSDNSDNIHKAIENHITDTGELVGQSKAVMRELGGRVDANGRVISAGKASAEDLAYLSNIAKQAKKQADEAGGAYDYSKEEQLAILRNGGVNGTREHAEEGQTFDARGTNSYSEGENTGPDSPDYDSRRDSANMDESGF